MVPKAAAFLVPREILLCRQKDLGIQVNFERRVGALVVLSTNIRRGCLFIRAQPDVAQAAVGNF